MSIITTLPEQAQISTTQTSVYTSQLLSTIQVPSLKTAFNKQVYPKESKQLVMDVLRAFDIDVFDLKRIKIGDDSLPVSKLSKMEQEFLSNSVTNIRLITQITNSVVRDILKDYGFIDKDSKRENAFKLLNSEQDGKIQEIVRNEILNRLKEGIQNYIKQNGANISLESFKFLEKLEEKASKFTDTKLQKWVPLEHVIGYMTHTLENAYTELNKCISDDLGKGENNFYIRQELNKLFKTINVGKSEDEVKENIKSYLKEHDLYKDNNEGAIKDRNIETWFQIFNNENLKLLQRYESLIRVININDVLFNDTNSRDGKTLPSNVIKPYDIKYDVENQSPEPARSIVETVSNAVDASFKEERVEVKINQNGYEVQDFGLGMNPYVILEKLIIPRISGKEGADTVGRFGIGFYTVLNHLKEKGDSAKIITCFQDKKYTLEFKKHERSGKIFVTVNTKQNESNEKGTRIIVTTNDTSSQDFELLCKDYFKYNLRNPIYLTNANNQRELINPLPKNSVKIKDGAIYFSQETVSSEREYGNVSLLVNGVKIEDIRTQGLNVPKDLIINFPINTKLLESRGRVVSNAETVEFLKNIILALKESEDVLFLDKIKVLNALCEVTNELEDRLETKLDFKLEDFLKLENKDLNLNLVPNSREYLPLKLGDDVIFVNDLVIPCDIKKVAKVKEIEEFNSSKKVFACEFKDSSKLYYVTKDSIFINNEIYELLKKSGNTAVINIILKNISTNIELGIVNSGIINSKSNRSLEICPSIKSAREHLLKYTNPEFTKWFEEYTKKLILGEVVYGFMYPHTINKGVSKKIIDKVNNDPEWKEVKKLYDFINELRGYDIDGGLFEDKKFRFDFLSRYNEFFPENFFDLYSMDSINKYFDKVFERYFDVYRPNSIYRCNTKAKYLLSNLVSDSQKFGKFSDIVYITYGTCWDLHDMEVVSDYYATLLDDKKKEFSKFLSCIDYCAWNRGTYGVEFAWVYTDRYGYTDEKLYETIINPFDNTIDYHNNGGYKVYKQIYKNAITFFDKYFDRIKDKEQFFNDFSIARDGTGKKVPEYLYPVFYFLLYGGELLESESNDPTLKAHDFNINNQTVTNELSSQKQEATLLKLIATKRNRGANIVYSKDLSSSIETTTDSLDTSKYRRELENAIYFQNDNQAQIINEQIQNSRDAIINSKSQNNSIDITCIREDDDKLTIECRDYVGMTPEEVLNYLFIPKEGSKKDNKELIGHFGQGFFSTLRGADEVRIKTSIGDGRIFYVKILPIILDEKIVDYKINFDLVTDNEDLFKGTTIQKVAKSSFPEYDAAIFKSNTLKLVEYIQRNEVDVRFNGASLNKNFNEVISLAYDDDKIRAFESTRNVITQHGFYVCDVYDEIIKGIPKYLENVKCNIEIPDSIGLVMGRNDIASNDSQKLKRFLSENFYKILFLKYAKDAIKVEQKLDLPYDLIKTYTPRIDSRLIEDARKIESGDLDFDISRYDDEQERIYLIFSIRDINLSINGVNSRYSVNDLISKYKNGSLDIKDENIKSQIPNWLLNAFLHYENDNNRAKQDEVIIRKLTEDKKNYKLDNIKRDSFKGRGFPQYELFSELLDYIAKCSGYEDEIKFCFSNEPILAHAYKGTERIEFNLLKWDFDINKLIDYLNSINDNDNIDISKLYKVLEPFIKTVTHEIVHTKENTDDSTHDNTFRNHHNEVLLSLIRNTKKLQLVSFIKKLKEKYGNNLPQANFKELFEVIN